jgi:hypothetical protein
MALNSSINIIRGQVYSRPRRWLAKLKLALITNKSEVKLAIVLREAIILMRNAIRGVYTRPIKLCIHDCILPIYLSEMGLTPATSAVFLIVQSF